MARADFLEKAIALHGEARARANDAYATMLEASDEDERRAAMEIFFRWSQAQSGLKSAIEVLVGME